MFFCYLILKGEANDSEFKDYKQTIDNLSRYSKNATVFALIHKMDKIKDSEKELLFNRKRNEIL